MTIKSLKPGPNITRTILNFTISGLLGLLLLTGAEYTYERFFLGADDYFQYYSIEPTQRSYSFDEPLEITSDSVIHKTADYHWNDILRCDFKKGKGFQYFSAYDSSADKYTPQRGLGVRGEGDWFYQAETPKSHATCFMDSTVTVEQEYGLSKEQKMTSGPFDFN